MKKNIVVFKECSDCQVNFGGYNDPRKHLILNEKYEVIECRISNWKTSYKLNGIQGTFNSVHFDKKPEQLSPEIIQNDYISIDSL